MKVKKFEDIVVWQKAKELTLKIYQYLKTCHDFGFKDQIQRSSISIMNNIAEGFERKGNKEFKHFLFVAKGSCGELRSMLYLGLELQYVNHQQFERLYNLSLEISKMLSGFIKTL